MTKKLLLVPFVLAIFMFASCDNSITYPEASEAEVKAAKEILKYSFVDNLFTLLNDNNDKIKEARDETVTLSVSDVKIELESGDESDLYSTFSCTVEMDFNSEGIESASIDISISGSGPVVTAYASINIPNDFDLDKMSDSLSDILDSLIITVNGHDMTEDFIDEITLIASNM